MGNDRLTSPISAGTKTDGGKSILEVEGGGGHEESKDYDTLSDYASTQLEN